MLDELAALATAGGTALVGAMATDAWQAARSGVARLFGRGGTPPETIEAQFDSHAALVADAEDPNVVRQSLAPVWQLQLEALLRQHPDIEEEMRSLVAEVQEQLPASQKTWVQTNIARDRATQNVENSLVHLSSHGGIGGTGVGIGARGGDGGSGGEIVSDCFLTKDLPEEVGVDVGKGGRGGVDGADGEDGGDTSFGEFLVARGGKGGTSGGLPSSVVGKVTVKLTGIFLANYSEMQNGLINVLGGGWDQYKVQQFPGLVRGCLVFFIEPEQDGQHGSTTCVFEILNDHSEVIWRDELTCTLNEFNVVRTSGILPFAVNAHRSGVWTVRVLGNGVELGTTRFAIVQGSSAWSRNSLESHNLR